MSIWNAEIDQGRSFLCLPTGMENSSYHHDLIPKLIFKNQNWHSIGQFQTACHMCGFKNVPLKRWQVP